VAPVVKIFACLDLEQNISSLDEHELTGSAGNLTTGVVTSGVIFPYPLLMFYRRLKNG
jgi:hypothetical protein